MKEKYTKVVNSYFSDLLQFVLILTGFFIVCAVLAFIINGMNIWNILVVVVYLLLMAFLLKPIIIYFKSDKDIEKEEYEQVSVEIESVLRDKSANLYMKDGLSGNVKYVLKTDNGDFLLSEQREKGSKNLKSETILIKDTSFDIVYLKRSRIIVDMKPTTVFEDEETTEKYNDIFSALYKQFNIENQVVEKQND